VGHAWIEESETSENSRGSLHTCSCWWQSKKLKELMISQQQQKTVDSLLLCVLQNQIAQWCNTDELKWPALEWSNNSSEHGLMKTNEYEIVVASAANDDSCRKLSPTSSSHSKPISSATLEKKRTKTYSGKQMYSLTSVCVHGECEQQMTGLRNHVEPLWDWNRD